MSEATKPTELEGTGVPTMTRKIGTVRAPGVPTPPDKDHAATSASQLSVKEIVEVVREAQRQERSSVLPTSNLDRSEPGGKFIVGGRFVNANGEDLGPVPPRSED